MLAIFTLLVYHKPPPNPVAWLKITIICAFSCVCLLIYSRPGVTLQVGSGLLHISPPPPSTNKLARTHPLTPQQHREARPNHSCACSTSVWILSANIPLTKANHVAEPKQKGRKVQLSSTQGPSSVWQRARVHGEMKNKGSETRHWSFYICKS